ncbi:hypothetical protein [Priestia megaterium]|uniref:hypothetical protein n=1 Tax=Priestia megaterium TaxID=1404 RepID=UPI002877B2F8|nr:hypothetical protein [Priestia megaterium]
MNFNRYKVIMSGYTAEVVAFNEKEATILAQAEAIQHGVRYDVISIKQLNDRW